MRKQLWINKDALLLKTVYMQWTAKGGAFKFLFADREKGTACS